MANNIEQSLTLKYKQYLDGLNKLNESSAKLEKTIERVNNMTTENIANQYAKQQKALSGELGVLAQITAQMKIQKELQHSNTASTEDIKKATLELKRLNIEYNKLTKAPKDLVAQTKISFLSMSQVMSNFRSLLLSTFGAYAVLNGIKATFNTIKEFEKSMTMVKAVTNATAEEFKALSNITRDLVRSGSIFDPKTIADAEVELSKLGFTANEIAVMIKPINDLAIATGEDLTQATEISTAAMRNFGLTASDLTKVIDVMGKAMNISALDISSWNEAAKYSTSVAAQLGWSIEDVASMMALLANNGIKGSMAGTAMRQMMLKLADSGSNLQKAMGGNITTFQDFIGGLERMKESGITLNEILKATDVRTSTAFAILESGVETLKSTRLAFDDVNGSIKQMAEINLVTLSSKIDILSASWKALILEFDQGNGTVSNIFKSSLDVLTDKLNELSLQEKYGFDLSRTFTQRIIQDKANIIKNVERNISESNTLAKKSYEDDIAALRESLLKKEITQEQFDSVRLNKHNELNDKLFKSSSALLESNLRTQLNLEIESSLKSKSESYVRAAEELLAYNTAILTNQANLSTSLSKKTNDELNMIYKTTVDNITRMSLEESKFEVELRKEKIIRDEINKILDNRAVDKKKVEETPEEKSKRISDLKKQYDLEHQIRLNAINADRALTNEQREMKLAIENSTYKERLYMLDANEAESLRLKEQYGELAKQQEQLLSKELLDIYEKYGTERLKIQQKNDNKLLESQKRTDKFEQELLRVTIDNLKKQLNEEIDPNEKRRITDLIFGAEYELELKVAQDEIDQIFNTIKARRDLIDSEVNKGKTVEEAAAFLGIDLDSMDELEKQLIIKMKRMGLITPEVQSPANKDIYSLLGIGKNLSDKDKELLQQSFDTVIDNYQRIADAAVQSAKVRVDAENRAVDELQQALETEIALAEAGFASNVTLKRKELEEQKVIRDQALKDQAEALKKQRAAQALSDAANLTSAIIQIIASEAKKGVIGIAVAAVGISGLLALVSGWKAKSAEIAASGNQFEKGGYKILGGKRHSQGGVSLGEMGEAEQGEMVSVFNRRATQKYGKNLAAFTDAVNKGSIDRDLVVNNTRVGNNNFTAKLDDRKLSDIHSVLEQVRDKETVVYNNGYKIIINGNRVRRVRTNG